MTSTGRNDPCPCGSGKKYKGCCLGRAAVPDDQTIETYTKADRVSALAQLKRFAERPEFEEYRIAALMLFWGRDLMERPSEELKRFADLGQAPIVFFSWWFFDCEMKDGMTIADLFVQQEGARLNAAERAYLAQATATYHSLYEVQEVRPDEGLRLTDLWTGERLWVRERQGTHGIIRWDILATRLIKRPEGPWEIESGVLHFPARTKELLIKRLKREHAGFRRACPTGDERAFLKGVGAYFGRWWLEPAVFPPLPKVVTAEGHEMVFAKVVFDTVNPTALETALRSASTIEKMESGLFDWFESAGDYQRTLGTIRLEQGRMVLETFSRERAGRGRRLLEEAAGKAIRYRMTAYEDVPQAIERVGRQPRKMPESTLPPEVEAAALKQFYDRHYRSWPDTPLPALNGRTPRHASRLKSQRERVINLLKELENSEAHGACEGRQPYDFGWLWAELGLSHP